MGVDANKRELEKVSDAAAQKQNKQRLKWIMLNHLNLFYFNSIKFLFTNLFGPIKIIPNPHQIMLFLLPPP